MILNSKYCTQFSFNIQVENDCGVFPDPDSVYATLGITTVITSLHGEKTFEKIS